MIIIAIITKIYISVLIIKLFRIMSKTNILISIII